MNSVGIVFRIQKNSEYDLLTMNLKYRVSRVNSPRLYPKILKWSKLENFKIFL